MINNLNESSSSWFNFHTLKQVSGKVSNNLSFIGNSLHNNPVANILSLKNKAISVVNTSINIARSKAGKIGIGMLLENAVEYVGYYAGIAAANPLIELVAAVSKNTSRTIGRNASQLAVTSASLGLLLSQMDTIRAAVNRENLSSQKLAQLASSLIVIAGINYSIPSMVEDLSGDLGEATATIVATHLAGIIGGYLSMKLEGFITPLIGVSGNEEDFLSLDDPLESYLIKSVECAVVGSAINAFSEPKENIVTQTMSMAIDTAIGSAVYNTVTVSRIVKLIKAKKLLSNVLPSDLKQLISLEDTKNLFDNQLKPLLKENIEKILQNWVMNLKNIQKVPGQLLKGIKKTAIEKVLDHTIKEEATRKCIDGLIAKLENAEIAKYCELIQEVFTLFNGDLSQVMSNVETYMLGEVLSAAEGTLGRNTLTTTSKQYLKEIGSFDLHKYAEELSQAENSEKSSKELNTKLSDIVKKIWISNIRKQTIAQNYSLSLLSDNALNEIAERLLQETSISSLTEPSTDMKVLLSNHLMNLLVLNSSLYFEENLIGMIPQATKDKIQEWESEAAAQLFDKLNEKFDLHSLLTNTIYNIKEASFNSFLINITSILEKNKEIATQFNKFTKVWFGDSPTRSAQLLYLEDTIKKTVMRTLRKEWKHQTLDAISSHLQVSQNIINSPDTAKFISKRLELAWKNAEKKLNISESIVEAISNSLESHLHRFEVDLIGVPISKEIQKEYLKACLKSYMPGITCFIVLNTLNDYSQPSPNQDPQNVYLGMSHLLFSYYSNALPFGLDFVRDIAHEQIANAKLLAA